MDGQDLLGLGLKQIYCDDARFGRNFEGGDVFAWQLAERVGLSITQPPNFRRSKTNIAKLMNKSAGRPKILLGRQTDMLMHCYQTISNIQTNFLLGAKSLMKCRLLKSLPNFICKIIPLELGEA